MTAQLWGGVKENSCLAPKPDEKKHEYCVSVPVGSTNPNIAPLSYSVNLQSKFFNGLKRVRIDNGFEFRKGRVLVTSYPDSFTVAVGAFSERTLKGADFPGTPLRVPSDEVPRRVLLLWKDSSGKVLEERSLALEEVVEPWPELGSANVWYRANVADVHQPLSAELEIAIFTEAQNPAQTARTCALGQCAVMKRVR